MIRALRVLALLSFVTFLAAATLGLWGRADAGQGAADAGADASVAAASAPDLYMAASKSFGGAPLVRGDSALGGQKAPGAVTFGEMTVVGPVSKGYARRLVEVHAAELLSCNDRRAVMALQSTLTVRWDVSRPGTQSSDALRQDASGSGPVSSAEVIEDGSGDSELTRCVLERVKQWPLPKLPPGAKATITFPFTLKARGAP
jgi:hypothetical protein